MKIDPDTVLVPQRLHTLLAARNPHVPVVLAARGEFMEVHESPAGRKMWTHIATIDGPLMPLSAAAFVMLRGTYHSACVESVADWRGQMGEDWFFAECCKLISVPLTFEPGLLHSTVQNVDEDCDNWQVVAFHGKVFKQRPGQQPGEEHARCVKVALAAQARRVERRQALLDELKTQQGAAAVKEMVAAKLLPLYSRSSNKYGLWYSASHPVDDWVQFTEHLPAKNKKLLQHMVAENSVTVEQAQAFLDAMRSGVRQQELATKFARFDKDGSGKIDYKQFKELLVDRKGGAADSVFPSFFVPKKGLN